MTASSVPLYLSESVPMAAIQEAEYMKATTTETMTMKAAKSPETQFALANWAILNPCNRFGLDGYIKINNRFILSTR